MPPRLLVRLGALFMMLAFALVLPRAARAAEPPARVSVLTMGPGEHPFTRFGHNALLLEWESAARPSLVYNFGTFQFEGLRGVQDFMAGRFRYWLSVSTLEATLRAYGAAQRSLTAQQLELTASERAELADSLAQNARPEHRYYDYDYYRDNCSTRVRDAIDRLLGGALRRQVTGPGRQSFRQHTLRLTATSLPLYVGLDLALGRPTDAPTTRWEELFLPQELHDELAHAERELHGTSVPLVRHERLLLRSTREPLPAEPPERSGAFAVIGLALGLLLAALGEGAARQAKWRAVLGLVTATGGAALGLLGVALLLFATSEHWAAHQNGSLLACPPWSLALLVLGVWLARGRFRTGWPLLAVLGASLLTSSALLLFGLTESGRESVRGAALFAPLWAGWLYGAWRATAPIAASPRASGSGQS